MSRVYGFRVYIIQAYPNRKSGNTALDVSHSSSAHDEILELLDRLRERGTVFFDPPHPRDGEPPRATASMTVYPSTIVRGDLVHTSVSMGYTGSHVAATRPNKKKAKQLKDWSPEAQHAVTLLFPDGPEDRFLLVAQTVRSADPTRRLLSLLAGESLALRTEKRDRDKSDREKARARGDKPAKAKTFYRLAFDYHQAADNRYVDDLLSNAESATARFVSKVPSDRSSSSNVVRRQLIVSLRDEEVVDIGRKVSRSWARRKRSGEATTYREGVSELSSLMEEHDLLDADEGSRYDKASLRVVDKNKDSTTIAVDTLRDVFTYPVSDGEPSHEYYYERVAPRVKIIAQDERLEIKDVDVQEVVQCLTDSTSAP